MGECVLFFDIFEKTTLGKRFHHAQTMPSLLMSLCFSISQQATETEIPVYFLYCMSHFPDFPTVQQRVQGRIQINQCYCKKLNNYYSFCHFRFNCPSDQHQAKRKIANHQCSKNPQSSGHCLFVTSSTVKFHSADLTG